jgi:phosphoglucosamine mutase
MIGGEASGHLICLDKTTTGDGIVSALQVLTVLSESDKSLSELAAEMPKFPQTMINVRVDSKLDLDSPAVQSAVSVVEQTLGDTGRVVLRASGTEPVIRVMIEGEDDTQVEQLASQLADAVRAAV